jgi:hypothetical protein
MWSAPGTSGMACQRLRACVEAGVEVRWTVWQSPDGLGPVAWVVS